MQKVVSLWMDLEIPSANVTRYQHWTKVRKHNEAAKLAWLSALKSSPSENGKLISIISLMALNHSEMLSPEASVLTMETKESAGSTIPSSPPEPQEPKS